MIQALSEPAASGRDNAVVNPHARGLKIMFSVEHLE